MSIELNHRLINRQGRAEQVMQINFSHGSTIVECLGDVKSMGDKVRSQYQSKYESSNEASVQHPADQR